MGGKPVEEPRFDGKSSGTYREAKQAWLASRTTLQSEPGDFQFPEPGLHNLQQLGTKDNIQPVKLRDDFRHLLVIFKLANIRLTPEKPGYKGGSWHVEGTAYESM